MSLKFLDLYIYTYTHLQKLNLKNDIPKLTSLCTHEGVTFKF